MKRIQRGEHVDADEAARLATLREEIAEEIPELLVDGEAMQDRMRRFGGQLRDARVSAGVDVDQLAERAGLEADAVRLLEEGRRNPAVDVLQRYAAALGKTLDIRLVDDAA